MPMRLTKKKDSVWKKNSFSVQKNKTLLTASCLSCWPTMPTAFNLTMQKNYANALTNTFIQEHYNATSSVLIPLSTP